jgi:GxxExxY protein
MVTPISSQTETVASEVLNAAFRVHTNLGPGLLESVYERCLCHELRKAGLAYEVQLVLPINYDGEVIDGGLRLDLVVEDQVIVELKAVERLLPIHEAQALTYLKLTGKRLALLLNFNTERLKEGIKRIAL